MGGLSHVTITISYFYNLLGNYYSDSSTSWPMITPPSFSIFYSSLIFTVLTLQFWINGASFFISLRSLNSRYSIFLTFPSYNIPSTLLFFDCITAADEQFSTSALWTGAEYSTPKYASGMKMILGWIFLRNSWHRTILKMEDRLPFHKKIFTF